MPFFRVNKIMQYTETVYVEAESAKDAENISGFTEGYINPDDTWIDSNVFEISEDEYIYESY